MPFPLQVLLPSICCTKISTNKKSPSVDGLGVLDEGVPLDSGHAKCSILGLCGVRDADHLAHAVVVDDRAATSAPGGATKEGTIIDSLWFIHSETPVCIWHDCNIAHLCVNQWWWAWPIMNVSGKRNIRIIVPAMMTWNMFDPRANQSGGLCVMQ